MSKYGYHFTNNYSIKDILSHGLLINYEQKELPYYYKVTLIDLIKNNDNLPSRNVLFLDYFIFNRKRPLFFIDTPDINRFTTKSMLEYVESKFNLFLKIDVSDYNQYPDYHMLVIDYGCRIHYIDNNFYFLINHNKDLYSQYINTNINHNKDLYLYLYDILNYYDYKTIIINNITKYTAIPFEDLKTNENLQLELIAYTNCFCIDQDIPPEKIIDISYI